ncbi:MAG: FUN14 domain-containing protein [Candidatus Nitrosopolaris sp.]
MPFEDFLFSVGGGFLLGAVAGYAIKKVMKIAAVVIGLLVAGLAYPSYKGWVDVKWAAMEDASRSTLTNASEQVVHALNNTATQFASHTSTLAASGLPIAVTFGFVLGLMMGFKKG